MQHVPQRSCIGCGRRAPKASLRRIVLAGDRVVADSAGTGTGRGAYLCGPGCVAPALRRRALGRAFKRAVLNPDDLVESIR